MPHPLPPPPPRIPSQARQKTEAGKVFPQTGCAPDAIVRGWAFAHDRPPPWIRLGAVLLEMYAHHYPERAAAQRLQRRLGNYGAARPPWRAA